MPKGIITPTEVGYLSNIKSDHLMEDPLLYNRHLLEGGTQSTCFNRSIAYFTSLISIYYFSVYDNSILQFLP